MTGALLARSEVYARMLAMIFALLDETKVINVAHIQAAECWIDYVRQTLQFLFSETGQQETAGEAERLAERLYDRIVAGGSATQTELHKALGGHVASANIKSALECLLHDIPPRIRVVKEKTAGATKTTYYPCVSVEKAEKSPSSTTCPDVVFA